MKPGQIAGLIALGLLCLYGYAVYHMAIDWCLDPPEKLNWLLHTMGSLVSALVIAVLAKGQAGETFGMTAERMITGKLPQKNGTIGFVATAYVLVWLGLGVLLVVIWLLKPDISKSLDAWVKAW